MNFTIEITQEQKELFCQMLTEGIERIHNAVAIIDTRYTSDRFPDRVIFDALEAKHKELSALLDKLTYGDKT